jgi:hypothetical protein
VPGIIAQRQNKGQGAQAAGKSLIFQYFNTHPP